MSTGAFAAAVHFVFGALFGLLVAWLPLLVLLPFLEADRVWIVPVIAGSCVLFGALAGWQKEGFWEYLKDHIWWRYFFGK